MRRILYSDKIGVVSISSCSVDVVSFGLSCYSDWDGRGGWVMSNEEVNPSRLYLSKFICICLTAEGGKTRALSAYHYRVVSVLPSAVEHSYLVSQLMVSS